MKKFNKKTVLSALIGYSLVCSISSCNAMEGEKESPKKVTFLYGGNFFKNGFYLELRDDETLLDALRMSSLLFHSTYLSHEEMQKRLNAEKDNVYNEKETYVFYRDEKGTLTGYMCLMKHPCKCVGNQSLWVVKEALTHAETSEERENAANELIKVLKEKNLRELLDPQFDRVGLMFYHMSLLADDYVKDAWKNNVKYGMLIWQK